MSSNQSAEKKFVQPFSHKIIAGGIAGVSEIMVMYPTDVIKTRAQLAKESVSLIGALSKIVKEEGPKKLYRGILPPILMEAPKRATKFAANEAYKPIFTGANGKISMPGAISAGVCAGLTESFVVVPFELVKIRLQAKENQNLYKNTFDALTKILQKEGIFSMYKGLESTLWRHASWNGGYFGVIHILREKFQGTSDESKAKKMFRNFIIGSMGGTFATMLNTPFDVAKTRIQNQDATLKAGEPKKYNWTIPALRTIFKEEGYAALYKGFIPKVVRLGPGGGILLVVFDFVSKRLEKWTMERESKQ